MNLKRIMNKHKVKARAMLNISVDNYIDLLEDEYKRANYEDDIPREVFDRLLERLRIGMIEEVTHPKDFLKNFYYDIDLTKLETMIDSYKIDNENMTDDEIVEELERENYEIFDIDGKKYVADFSNF